MPIDQLGRELKDLRISVTDRCNFRCQFCMPEGENYEFFRREEILSFEEIARVVRIVKGLGVKKVRLTGGEPLLRRHLEKLVALHKPRGGGHSPHHKRLFAKGQSPRFSFGGVKESNCEPSFFEGPDPF
jgi:molybdenum cofactor biosynthesis enzyme MoaA